LTFEARFPNNCKGRNVPEPGGIDHVRFDLPCNGFCQQPDAALSAGMVLRQAVYFAGENNIGRATKSPGPG
jgi:hypothetical protein